MKWHEILTASFGVRWNPEGKDLSYHEDMKLWVDELKETVYGWKNASSDQINDELCKVLRYVSNMEPMLRADQSQKSAKYNCRDVRVWVYRYRGRSRPRKHVQYVSGVTMFATRLKRTIAGLLLESKHLEAKALAEQPFYPENPTGNMQYDPPHVYTDEERSDVISFLEDQRP